MTSEPSPVTAAIDLNDLRYGYRNHWTYYFTELLHGITLQVTPGEAFGFLGHNGAGKTTTIKCILGLIKATSGTIKIFGKETSDTSSRSTVGYLAEQPYFYDQLTVRETMELYATLTGLTGVAKRKQIDWALDMVKVSARAKSPMRSLSKGLTQRVGMAQAIVAKPKLLILDEPFSGLDPIGRKEFRDLLQYLKSEQTTIFMSSHILSDVEFLCDRVSILARGTLKGVFSISEIPRLTGGSYELVVANSALALSTLKSKAQSFHESARFLRLTFNSREPAEQALSQAISSSIHVESFNFNQGSLEELFVKLVQFDEAGGKNA